MLIPGQRIGPYTIISAIGSGGMGEVYRARDPRLDRDVAIKVLPAVFAADTGRAARFEQEARTIAALSHPNIVAIFDTGLADAGDAPTRQLYVVTELLEGETLRERVAAGALGVRKAIEIGVQIARGLAAAHDKGIVHRDLKPENVFITADGHVKVLDFGLARTVSAVDAAGASATRPALTDAGTVLGTVGYMAPEQLRGQTADARADLFALGAVLYEMFAGQRAFRGDSPAEIMSAILKADPPDLAAARPDVPATIERIVSHCLEKHPDERFHSARDVAFALEALSGSGMTPGTVVASPVRRVTLERIAWSLVTTALAAWLIWTAVRRTPPPEAVTAPHRARILLPEGVTLTTEGAPGARLALSPDGTQLAFVGSTDRGPMLWLQSLNDTTPRSIEGSEGADAPFWSSDGRILAFVRNGRIVKLDVYGSGGLTELGNADGTATWLRGPSGEDLILTARAGPQSNGIRRLSIRDGAMTDLFSGKPSEIYLFPRDLYDRRHFLFTHADLDDLSTIGVYLGELGTTDKRRLLALDPDSDQVNSYYASGYLLTARNQSVLARPFDRRAMTVGSEVTDIAGPIQTSARGGGAFSVSQNGVLVYEPGFGTDRYRIVVQDRTGQAIRTLSDDAGYSNLELSPDGSQLAVSVPDPMTRTRDIWVIDVVRGVRTRVTFDPSDERSAVWSLDGKSLVYRSKELDLYTRTVGAGSESPFVKDGVSKDPRGWSRDGEFFAYRATGNAGRNDLWIKPRDPAKKPYPFLATPFDENYATFAPDSRWLAYVSNESGRPEVYATKFPSGEGKWQISTSGGLFPRWRGDGKEIVYLSLDNKLMSATVDGTGAALTVSTTQLLFQTRAAPGPGTPFDMTADGQRFVINSVLPSAAPPSLVVVYNWPALIGKK